MFQEKRASYLGWAITGLCLAEAVATRFGLGSSGTPRVTGLPARAAIGQPAPPWVLRGEDGRLHDQEDAGGRPVLLLFLCGCSPCRKVVTALRAAGFPGRRKIAVFGVTTMGLGDAHQFRRQTGLPFPLLIDSDGATSKAYDVARCPRLWLLDEHGYARATNGVGGDPARQSVWLISRIDAVLRGRSEKKSN